MKSIFLAVALLCSAVVFHRLSQDKFLRGTDAYYYALQADTWTRTGDVRIPDSSPLHRLIGATQKLGVSTETSIRIWIAIFIFIGTLGPLFLMKGKPLLLQILVVGWSLLSPSLLFNAIEFPKMFMMMAWIPLWFLIPRSNRFYVPLLLFVCLLTLILHKSALLMIAPFLLVSSISSIFPLRRLPSETWVLIMAPVLLLLFGYIVFWSDRFHLTDFQRLSFENLNWGLIRLFNLNSLPVAIKLELALSLLMAGILVRQSRNWKALALLFPILLPFGGEEVLGVGERYSLLLPQLTILLWSLSSWETARTMNRQAVSAFFVFTTLVGSWWRLDTSHPLSVDPPFSDYKRISDRLHSREIPMLIAHRGLNFGYKFWTKKESFPYEPESHWEKTKIWRVAYGISADEFNYHLPETCGWSSPNLEALPVVGYTLIREDCWETFRAKIDPSLNPELYSRVFETWQNPSKKRPAFLYEKHKKDLSSEFPSRPV